MGRVYECYIMFWHIDCPVRVVSTDVCHLYKACGDRLHSFKNLGMIASSVLKCRLWLREMTVLSVQTPNLNSSALYLVFKSKGKVLSLSCFSGGSDWHQMAYLW